MTIMIKITKNIKHWVLFAVIYSLLSACGGEQALTPTTSSSEQSAQAPVNESSGEQEKPQVTQATERVIISTAFDEANLDQDSDGLIDSIDNDPLTPLALVRGNDQLSLAFIGSEIEGRSQNNIIVAGSSISGRVDNSQQYSPPYYLLWHNAQGTQAQAISLDQYGQFTTTVDEIDATGVSIAAQGVESEALIIQSYSALAPLIFPQTETLFTGDPIDLLGVNLEKITELKLGSVPLDIALSNGKIESTLPLVSVSNVLSWTSEAGTFRQVLPLKRKVELLADEALAALGAWSALGEEAKLVLSSENSGVMAPTSLVLPVANKPSYVRFYHANNRSVEGVIWPHTTRLVLGTQSTLASHIARNIIGRITGHISNLEKPSQLETVADLLDYTFSTNTGIEVLQSLQHLHAQAINIENEQLLRTQVDSMIEALASNSDDLHASLFSLGKTPPIQRSSSLFDYLDDTFASIFATNVMYQPISKVVNKRAVHGGNSYSGMSIGMYRDATTCIGLESLNPPAGLWPSDLCARNTAVYFASVKITNAVSNKVLKNHVSEFLDTSMIGASGWGILALDQIAYLTSDKGAPLCHMQACTLEFITGGLGLGAGVSLTRAQQKTYNIVMGRTMLERVVLPTVGYLLGKASVDGDTGQCLAKFILSSGASSVVSYGTMIAEFKKKIDGASSESEIENTLIETVAKYAYDVAAGMLKSEKLPTCLSGNLTNDLLDSLKDKVSDFAKKAAIPFEVADKATIAYQGFEAVSAPETFTFEVAPRAAITSISTSNSSDDIPELYSTIDNNNLIIRGTKFVYLKSDNSTYWPKLRLQDRFGNKQTMQLGEQHKIDISDRSWVDIAIPVSDLKPLMAKLQGELIDVSILMADQSYPEFSSEGLPVPGRTIRWVGQPKLFKATPQNARAGRLITLRGENLQSFKFRSDLKLKFILANDVTQSADITKVESASSTSIQFRLPSNTPVGLYKLRLETSDPELQLDVPDDVLKGTSVGAINIIPQSASLIALYDAGAKIDDAMIVYVNNIDGNLLIQDEKFVGVQLLEGNRLPAVTTWWTTDGVSVSDGGPIAPGKISVQCDLGGTDGICTYRVKGEVNVNGTFKNINFRGKLRTGESVIHDI